MTNTPTTTLDALQSEQSKVVKTKVIRLNDLIQFLQVKFSLSPDIRYPSLKDAYYWPSDNDLYCDRLTSFWNMSSLPTRDNNGRKYISKAEYADKPLVLLWRVYTQDGLYIFIKALA